VIDQVVQEGIQLEGERAGGGGGFGGVCGVGAVGPCGGADREVVEVGDGDEVAAGAGDEYFVCSADLVEMEVTFFDRDVCVGGETEDFHAGDAFEHVAGRGDEGSFGGDDEEIAAGTFGYETVTMIKDVEGAALADGGLEVDGHEVVDRFDAGELALVGIADEADGWRAISSRRRHGMLGDDEAWPAGGDAVCRGGRRGRWVCRRWSRRNRRCHRRAGWRGRLR
jgi:hypothetical protein